MPEGYHLENEKAVVEIRKDASKGEYIIVFVTDVTYTPATKEVDIKVAITNPKAGEAVMTLSLIHIYNVDTDVIIPALHLNTQDAKELASHCMEDIDKDFVNRVQPGDITVSYTHLPAGGKGEPSLAAGSPGSRFVPEVFPQRRRIHLYL